MIVYLPTSETTPIILQSTVHRHLYIKNKKENHYGSLCIFYCFFIAVEWTISLTPQNHPAITQFTPSPQIFKWHERKVRLMWILTYLINNQFANFRKSHEHFCILLLLSLLIYCYLMVEFAYSAKPPCCSSVHFNLQIFK